MDILLVDDDEFLRDMYATKFSEGGHKVDDVSDAKAALSALEKNSYHAVLLDMVMPGMTGLELLEKVTSNGLKKEAKFIVLSNQSEVSDQSSAKAAGADGYIIKAESIPSEVVKKVEEIVGSSKSSES